MRTSNGRNLYPWLAWLLLLAGGPRLAAQELDFYTDYTWARSLAATTGRPLIVSVGGPHCVECIRLHATTFRDRGIAGTLGQIFIAVKIDAQRDAELVQAMGITSFPMVILAASDGTVLHSVSGFVDAAQMTEHVNLALVRLQNYRAGLRPGTQPPIASGNSAGQPAPFPRPSPQISQSYYGPQPGSAPQTAYWNGSPYSYGPGRPSGQWTTPYLSSYPDYFATPRRC